MTDVIGRIDVFISYKREERALSEAVRRALIKAGYTAVTDLNIGRNEDFGDAIDTMIRTATLTMVLWTKASASSDWVRKEARLARDLEKAGKRNRYVGVMVENVDLDLPPDLRGLQMIDLHDFGLDEAGMAELLDAAREILGSEAKRNAQKAERDSEALAEEWQLYDLARSINVAASYDRYLSRYPNGEFSEDAHRQLRMFTWYLHPFRRSNIAHTLASLGIFATVCVTIWATTRDPVMIGVDPDEHQALTLALESDRIAALKERDRLATDLTTAQAALDNRAQRLEAALSLVEGYELDQLKLEAERDRLQTERDQLGSELEVTRSSLRTFLLEQPSQLLNSLGYKATGPFGLSAQLELLKNDLSSIVDDQVLQDFGWRSQMEIVNLLKLTEELSEKPEKLDELSSALRHATVPIIQASLNKYGLPTEIDGFAGMQTKAHFLIFASLPESEWIKSSVDLDEFMSELHRRRSIREYVSQVAFGMLRQALNPPGHSPNFQVNFGGLLDYPEGDFEVGADRERGYDIVSRVAYASDGINQDLDKYPIVSFYGRGEFYLSDVMQDRFDYVCVMDTSRWLQRTGYDELLSYDFFPASPLDECYPIGRTDAENLSIDTVE